MKKRILALALTAVMALGLTACGGGNSGSSSGSGGSSSGDGTVKIVCGYGVGGTADAIARKYALVANRLHSEYNFIVENMTGGDGFAAADYYTDLDPSTRELLVYGYGLIYRHDLGKTYGTENVDFDRADIQPIGCIDDRTWILYSTPDQTLANILTKAKDSGIKMSGGNPLSDPHLALGSLIAMEGGKLMVVPYDGGAGQKKGLTDGEVDVFIGTTQAAQDEVEAGTLVPLLAFSDSAFEGFVGPNGAITVPSVAGDAKDPALDASKDYTSCILKSGGFIATRTGADQAWVDELTQITKDVWADAEFADWMTEILLNKHEAYGADAVAELEEASQKALAAYKTLSGQ